MTNEEKAREIAHNCCSHIMGGELSDETCFTTEPDCCKASMEMAEWKDKQTREKWHTVLNWLERNAKKYCLPCGAASYDTGMLIYELRKATEGGEG